MESREDSGKECEDCVEAVRTELRLAEAELDEPMVKFWTAAGCEARLHPIDVAFFCERQLLWSKVCKSRHEDLKCLSIEQRRNLLEFLFSGADEHHVGEEIDKMKDAQPAHRKPGT